MPTEKFDERNCVFQALSAIFEDAGHNLQPKSSTRVDLVRICQENPGLGHQGVSAWNTAVDLENQGLTSGSIRTRKISRKKSQKPKKIKAKLKKDLRKGKHVLVNLRRVKGRVGHTEPLYPSDLADEPDQIQQAAIALNHYGGQTYTFRPIKPKRKKT